MAAQSNPSPLTIDLTNPDLSVQSGHLKMGGANPRGVEINASSRYLTLAGRPWTPVMGEFHFSRYPAQDWREELLKMKAGGIHIASTYIFWIHHEEVEGQFEWTGSRDLRRFVELCAEVGLCSYPRLGPWAHGECRNGGLPDWLLAKCGDQVRTDDPQYLFYVRRHYAQIVRQLSGLLWKDGGPVVGVQLENELYHNPGHILTLKKIARELGCDVPLYTMTGWGAAEVPPEEVIPLFGGYPDAFWDRHADGWSRPSRKHYFFSRLRDDSTIGADLRKAEGAADVAFLERYPYATCELGGGMQVSYHRRPFILPEDVGAMALAKLGSGSNLLGYYMYHGGSNPAGKLSTLQESQATAYPNDLPVINYDFQTALREYGQLNASYHHLRRLHLFVNDYGGWMAGMPMTLPDRQPASLDDRDTLRWSVRSDGGSGFIFINNHQRVETLPGHSNVQLRLKLKGEALLVPTTPVEIPPGVSTIWPFNLDLNTIRLRCASAQPVCVLQEGGVPCYVFAERAGIPAEFSFDPRTLVMIEKAPAPAARSHEALLLRGLKTGSPAILHGKGGKSARLLLLSEEQSLRCWHAQLWGQERLVLSPAGLVFDGDALRLSSRSREELWFALYPAPAKAPAVDGKALKGVLDGCFTRYTLSLPEKNIPLAARKVKGAGPARPVPLGPFGVAQAPEDVDFTAAEEWEVRIPADALDSVADAFLCVDYAGDAARALLGECLVADDFHYGRVWEIGLKRFAPEVLEKGLTLRFLPLRQDAPIYIAPEHRPVFAANGEALEVRAIRAEPEYAVTVQLSA